MEPRASGQDSQHFLLVRMSFHDVLNELASYYEYSILETRQTSWKTWEVVSVRHWPMKAVTSLVLFTIEMNG